MRIQKDRASLNAALQMRAKRNFIVSLHAYLVHVSPYSVIYRFLNESEITADASIELQIRNFKSNASLLKLQFNLTEDENIKF